MMNKNIFRITIFLCNILLKSSVISVLITSFNNIQQDFHLNLTNLGIITSSFYLSSFFGSFIWANLMGRLSRRSIYYIGGFFWSISLILMRIDTYLVIYLILIGVVGFSGESFNLIVINEIIDNSNPTTITKNNVLFIATNGFGILLGTMITSTLEQNFLIKWNQILLFIGLIGGCFFVVYFIFFQQEKKTSKVIDATTHILNNQIDQKIDKNSLRYVFKDPINVLIIVIFLIIAPFNTFNNVWLQKYYTDFRHINQLMASISFIFSSGAEFLGLISAGFLIDGFFQKHKIPKAIIGFVSSTLGATLMIMGLTISWEMPVAPDSLDFIAVCIYMFQNAITDLNTALAYICIFFGFYFLSFQIPLFMVLIAENNEKKFRSIMINISAIINSLSWVIGPILGGFIGDLYNLQFTLLITPILYICVGSLFLIIYKLSRNKENQADFTIT